MRASGLLIVVAGLAVGGCEPTLSQKLKQRYEMDLLRPASTLYIPGTIAAVNVVSESSSSGRIVSLHRYCRASGALPLTAMPTSKTETFTHVYDVSADASAKAEIQSLVGFEAKLEYVDKVEITLKNPTLYVPDDLQLRAAAKAIRQSGCSVGGREQVISVLQADVDVKTTFKNSASLSVNQKQAIGKLIGASLGANFSSGNSETSSGVGLFYGIRTDPNVRL